MEVIGVLVGSLVFAPSVVAFVDAQRFADPVWRRADLSLLLWTVVIVCLPLVGPLAFTTQARPRLVRALAESRPRS